MKMILISLSILLCATHWFPAFCQTPQNTVETEIAVIKTEIKNLKEIINNGFNNVNNGFNNVNNRFDDINDRFNNVNDRFNSVQKNFDRQNNIIIACIGIPFALLAIGATVWGILAHKRSRKDQTLEKQIEMLTQEIETLKQKQIITP